MLIWSVFSSVTRPLLSHGLVVGHQFRWYVLSCIPRGLIGIVPLIFHSSRARNFSTRRAERSHRWPIAESLEYYRKAYTDSWVDQMRLITVLSHLGRIDEARAEIPAALKLRPDMSVHEYDRWVRLFCVNDDWRQRIATGLRLAGFREEANENRAPQADAGAAANSRP
jgi:hypothetical protein